MHGIMPMAVVFIHGEALREILIELSVGSGRKVSMGNSPYESHLNDSVMKSKLADPIPLRLSFLSILSVIHKSRTHNAKPRDGMNALLRSLYYNLRPLCVPSEIFRTKNIFLSEYLFFLVKYDILFLVYYAPQV